MVWIRRRAGKSDAFRGRSSVPVRIVFFPDVKISAAQLGPVGKAAAVLYRSAAESRYVGRERSQTTRNFLRGGRLCRFLRGISRGNHPSPSTNLNRGSRLSIQAAFAALDLPIGNDQFGRLCNAHFNLRALG